MDRRRLCRKCRKRPRRSLYFCKECLEQHNKKTRELKLKYRKAGKCVMCGQPSNNKRRCKECEDKNTEYVKNSKYLQAKKSKLGCFGGLKQLSEVI